jgi:hypothetical protein
VDALISIVSPGGSHRATVEVSRVLTTTDNWERRGYFQILASDDKYLRSAAAVRLPRTVVSLAARAFFFEGTAGGPILAWREHQT